MQYPAVVTREGRFILVEFPDCPGCQTFVEEGESIEDAAEEALAGWLESNLGRDLVPPQPSHTLGKSEKVLLVPVNPFLGVRLELRWARDDEELTQATLARKVGMTQQQLAKLESGNSNPTVSTLSRIAAGLGRRVVLSLEKRDFGQSVEGGNPYIYATYKEAGRTPIFGKSVQSRPVGKSDTSLHGRNDSVGRTRSQSVSRATRKAEPRTRKRDGNKGK